MDETPQDASIAPAAINGRTTRPVGKPFAKGMSGNPSGRPRIAQETRELARALVPEAIATLAVLMRTARKEADRISACNSILDRALGKPAQAHHLESVDGEGPAVLEIVRKLVVSSAE